MAQKKQKTLNYRRVRLGDCPDDKRSLEELLRDAHSRLTFADDRRFDSYGRIIQGINFKDKNPGFFLHVVVFAPGQETLVVPNATKVTQAEVKTLNSPHDAEFMNGDIMAFIRKNHVFFCTSHSHENYIQRYFSALFEAAESGKRGKHVSLERVGDLNKLEVLRKDGIKKICLNATLYGASVKHSERKNAGLAERVVSGVTKGLQSIFIDDSMSFTDDDDLLAELSIKPGGKVENENLRQEKLINFSKKLLDEFGPSVYYDHAWDELEKYFIELNERNLLSV